jgi:hypothetical protein
MPCQSAIRYTEHPNGAIDNMSIRCNGSCSGQTPCSTQILPLANGGFQMWCGCTPEDRNCRPGFTYTPGQKPPWQISCLGQCTGRKKCTPKPRKIRELDDGTKHWELKCDCQ